MLKDYLKCRVWVRKDIPALGHRVSEWKLYFTKQQDTWEIYKAEAVKVVDLSTLSRKQKQETHRK